MVGYVDVLRSSIVDRIRSNVDAKGIICYTGYGDGITELCKCIEVPDCLTRCAH